MSNPASTPAPNDRQPRRRTDPGFYGQIGRKGGKTTKLRYGSDHYAQIGRRGGLSTKARNGDDYYGEIGRKGGQRVRELIELGKQSAADDASA